MGLARYRRRHQRAGHLGAAADRALQEAALRLLVEGGALNELLGAILADNTLLGNVLGTVLGETNPLLGGLLGETGSLNGLLLNEEGLLATLLGSGGLLGGVFNGLSDLLIPLRRR